MKTHQNSANSQNPAQRLQHALGLFKPPTGGVDSSDRGIGVVDPDGDNPPGELCKVERGEDAGNPYPTLVPCQTGIHLPANERISEGAQLNPSIHRIKYE